MPKSITSYIVRITCQSREWFRQVIPSYTWRLSRSTVGRYSRYGRLGLAAALALWTGPNRSSPSSSCKRYGCTFEPAVGSARINTATIIIDDTDASGRYSSVRRTTVTVNCFVSSSTKGPKDSQTRVLGGPAWSTRKTLAARLCGRGKSGLVHSGR